MRSNIYILIISSLVIATVHILEFNGYAPCDICLKQRWVWYLVILLSFLSIFFNKKILKINLIFFTFLFIGNSIYAGWHAGIEWNLWLGPDTCSSQSNLDHNNFLEEIRSIKFIPCNEASLRIFGISLAGYNSIISFCMFVYSMLSLRKES